MPGFTFQDLANELEKIVSLIRQGSWVLPGVNCDITAASCSLTDVQTAVTAAASGQTVCIPAGSAVWAGNLSITKAIRLHGAGKTLTLISNSSNQPYNHAMVEYLPNATEAVKRFEMDGISFDASSNYIGGASTIANGCFLAQYPSAGNPITGLKIHDCIFKNAFSRAVVMYGLEFGVFYSNDFIDNYIHVSGIGSEGNGWAYSYAQGGPNYPYIEDCNFSETFSHGGFVIETGRGGRVAFRYNSITNYGGLGGEVWDAHGVNGTYPTDRGTVGVEYYNNHIGVVGSVREIFHRGGQGVVANNNTSSGTAYTMMTEYQGWSYCTLAGYPKPDQVSNAMYWNNGAGNPTLYCPSTTPGCTICAPPQYDTTYLQQNRDFFFASSVGLESALPVSPSVNDTYGSTDTTKFWRCIAPGAWTLLFTPYTYPHPFRT